MQTLTRPQPCDVCGKNLAQDVLTLLRFECDPEEGCAENQDEKKEKMPPPLLRVRGRPRPLLPDLLL